eukprot:1188433-Prorocentrum_minimum.AAC.2
MAPITYIHTMMNIYNDLRRDILSEAINVLRNENLLTDEIRTMLTQMTLTANEPKKKQPRFSGYHIFLKEHREVVKLKETGITPQRLTTIVSKAWKNISEDEKRELNVRALKMKAEYYGASKFDNESTNEKEVITAKTSKTKIFQKDCLQFLKERYPQVRLTHLQAAAKHMITFLKEHENGQCESSDDSKEEESDEPKSELESESESDKDSDDEEDVTDLASKSSDDE